MLNGNFIPVVMLVLVAPFIFAICMVLIKSNEKYRLNQLKADLYMKALEKGEPLPTNLFDNPNKKMSNSLKTAIILISIGVGISLFQLFTFASGNLFQDMSAGLIPLCLGIGFLIIHFIWKKQGIEDEE
ncbi:hypothetical protein DW103_02070 [Parabacteroides sp. AM08-6]|nr:hypothetical protein DW103_02070 [Parabacteroides sp. AM08-6]